MQKARYHAGLIVLALVLLTSACLLASGRGHAGADPAIRLELPDRLLEFTGTPVLFCQSDQCARSFTWPDPSKPHLCPVCGGALDVKAAGEKAMLPADTCIIRRRYSQPGGASYLVSIVLSGSERRSIHRPQVCLIGQGFRITSQHVVRPAGADRRLAVMKLSILPPAASLQRGEPPEAFAYWFVGGTHRTPYHFMRIFWTAWEGAVHNSRSRWAYVAVSGPSFTTQPGMPEPWERIAAALNEWLLSSPSSSR